ncbi:MAG: hypothetical protein K0B37_04175 [Bacteroidales bacterium]|nr:hypothetical protein [Bacteroidales bacterium]
MPQTGLFNKYCRIILLFSMVFSIYSCETSEGEPAYLGTEYFGHAPGKWVIYNVDSTVYDDFLGEVFHYNYQVMEVNAGFYNDSEGDESMRLERFWRPGENDSWRIKNVWSSRILRSKALKTEENITYIKLAFPLRSGQGVAGSSWDGNAFNNKPEQIYRLLSLHETLELGGHNFDSTARVMQKDFVTLIGEELQYEIFARNIGMIYKRYVDLSKEVDGTIVRGVDYTYEIADFGMQEPD